MSIYIGDDAFIALTLSAIETSIKYEATGILLGYRSGRDYYIANAVPYQLAERTSESVYVPPRRQKRIRRIFKNYLKYEIVGEFHTHPDGIAELSRADRKVIRSSGHQLEIVIAISKNDSDSPWHYEKGVLSGSIDKYELEIACWKVKDKRTTKLTVQCPYAVGFDFTRYLS